MKSPVPKPGVGLALLWMILIPGLSLSHSQSGKTAGKAYLYTGLNTIAPLAAAIVIDENTGSASGEAAALALFSYGLAIGPFTGSLYFADYKRALIRSSANILASSLFLVGANLIQGNVINDDRKSDALFFMGWAGLGAGGMGLLANSIFGVKDIPESRRKYLAKISPTMSFRRTENGALACHFGINFEL